jgi:benzoate membrane transport protein
MLKPALGPIEPASPDRPTLDRILRDLGPVELANGTIGFLFAVTGPLAIILAVGSGAGLNQAQLASWVFGVFFINGLISLIMTWLYRQPLRFFWTIPGTVLVGPALEHMTFADVVGAFIGSSALVVVLALIGLQERKDFAGRA